MRVAGLTFFLVVLLACNRHGGNLLITGQAPIIVYRTSEDFSKLVPVSMNEDKTDIVQYFHPGDLLSGEELRLPYHLKKGYLLDNQGIGPNVAFLDISYEEYAGLKEAPSIDFLLEHLKEANPLLEMYRLPPQAKMDELPERLNRWILHDSLTLHGTKIK